MTAFDPKDAVEAYANLDIEELVNIAYLDPGQKKLVASSGNNVASGVINLTRCTAPLGEKLVAFMRQGAFGCELVVLGIQPDDCDAEVLCPS